MPETANTDDLFVEALRAMQAMILRAARESIPHRLVAGPARHRAPANPAPTMLAALLAAALLTAFTAGTATARPAVEAPTAQVALTACTGAPR